MLDFIEFIRFITFLLAIVVAIEGAITFIYYPYVFVPKFNRKNNIKESSNSTLFAIRMRSTAIMWLSVEEKGSRRYNNIVKHYHNDFYVSQYLKLPPEVLKKCKHIYINFMVGGSCMITVSFLVCFLEIISK